MKPKIKPSEQRGIQQTTTEIAQLLPFVFDQIKTPIILLELALAGVISFTLEQGTEMRQR